LTCRWHQNSMIGAFKYMLYISKYGPIWDVCRFMVRRLCIGMTIKSCCRYVKEHLWPVSKHGDFFSQLFRTLTFARNTLFASTYLALIGRNIRTGKGDFRPLYHSIVEHYKVCGVIYFLFKFEVPNIFGRRYQTEHRHNYLSNSTFAGPILYIYKCSIKILLYRHSSKFA